MDRSEDLGRALNSDLAVDDLAILPHIDAKADPTMLTASSGLLVLIGDLGSAG